MICTRRASRTPIVLDQIMPLNSCLCSLPNAATLAFRIALSVN